MRHGTPALIRPALVLGLAALPLQPAAPRQPRAPVPLPRVTPPLPPFDEVLPLVWNAPAVRRAWAEALRLKARGDAAGVDWTDMEQETPEAAAAVAEFVRYGLDFNAAVGAALLDLRRRWLAQGHAREACQAHALRMAQRMDEYLDQRVGALLEPAPAR